MQRSARATWASNACWETDWTSLVSPSWLVLPRRRTVTRTFSPFAAAATSAPAEGRVPVAGGEDGGQVRRPERPRLSSAAVAGGPPVAGEDPGGAFPGWARLTGKAGTPRPPPSSRSPVERGRGGTGWGEEIHLHHRRRSIHVSPGFGDPHLEAVEAGLELAEPDLGCRRGRSSTPNQKVPFGSRVGSRAVRDLAPPGGSARRLPRPCRIRTGKGGGNH